MRNRTNKNTNSSPATSPLTRLQNHGGRFITLNTQTKKDGRQSYCAKILSISNSYVTFLDVNSKVTRKVSTASLV